VEHEPARNHHAAPASSATYYRHCANRSNAGTKLESGRRRPLSFKGAASANNCAPSESNSEVKKSFQGSGLDLALTAALGRLK